MKFKKNDLQTFLAETKLPYHQGKILEYVFYGDRSLKESALDSLTFVTNEVEQDFLFLISQDDEYIDHLNCCLDKFLENCDLSSDKKQVIRQISTIHIFSGSFKQRLKLEIFKFISNY
jgi:hypothetical protein